MLDRNVLRVDFDGCRFSDFFNNIGAKEPLTKGKS